MISPEVDGKIFVKGTARSNERLLELKAILLKVMAGDKFHVQAKGYWSDGTPGTSTDPLRSIVSALIAGAPGASGGKIASGQLTSTLLYPQVTSFLGSQPYDDTKPKTESVFKLGIV